MITLKEVKEMASDKGAKSRIGSFSTLRKNQKINENWYDLQQDIKVHEVFKKIKLPSARQMVETFVAHLPLGNPEVKVTPARDTEDYKKRTSKQRDFYEALLLYNSQQIDNFMRSSAKDIGLRGEAFLKVQWNKNNLTPGLKGEAWDEEVLERMPLSLLVREPRNCYPNEIHNDCRPYDMLEQYSILAGTVKVLYPGMWKCNKADRTIITFTEYWDKDSMCLLADGEPIGDGVFENPFGFVPYVHVYSGYGHRDSNNSPESKAVGIFQACLDLLAQQSRYYSYLDIATAFAAMPQVILPGRKEDLGPEGGKDLIPKPGRVWFTGETPESAKIVWTAQGIPAGIIQAIAMNQNLLGQIQSDVLRGTGSVESGYPMSLMIGEAKLQFSVPLENLQNLFSRALEMVRLTVKNVIRQEIPIWSKSSIITLSPKDCEGAYRISVSFDSSTTEAAINRALTLQKLRQGGDISKETALELNPLIKDPYKELVRLQAEQLLSHSSIQQWIALKAINAKAGADAAQSVADAMKEGQAGAIRKSESTGIPIGGVLEKPQPQSVIEQAMSRKAITARSGVNEEPVTAVEQGESGRVSQRNTEG